MTIAIVLLFVAGYVAIIAEHTVRLSKSASALLTGVACWTAYVLGSDPTAVDAELHAHLAEISGILFFLFGAMTIVELVEAHGGFDLVTSRITARSNRALMIKLAGLAFFLSAMLDNLITSIVMMSLVRRLVSDDDDRRIYGGMIVIAANAGGAWSPIGDVTTTMLWIGGQTTSGHLVAKLLVPSLVSLLVPLAWITLRMPGRRSLPPRREAPPATPSSQRERVTVLVTGIAALAFVPVFKAITHLPPFMGVLLGLGVLWAVTEILEARRTRERPAASAVVSALRRVDTPSILFFLGILLAIAALASTGVLHALAELLERRLGNHDLVVATIGLASAVVDNVPLVGAAQGMYPLAAFPTDHTLWTFLAYCAGTGGSVLIIGSAAGIAVMGIQRISFGWYIRHMALPALLGYGAGALTYLALSAP